MPISLNARTATYYQTIQRTSKEVEYAKKRNINNLIQYRDKKAYNGELSDRTKTKIKNLSSNLILINATNIEHAHTPRNKHKTSKPTYNSALASPAQNVTSNKIRRQKVVISFVTLTLSSTQQHTDNEIKRDILQPFIADLKRNAGLKYYIWVAETQANGNIHFHIITPTYIDKEFLTITWNKHQNNLGYITRSKYKNPPSTNIKGVKNTGKAIAYITKYVSKGNKERRKITGRLWGCDTETEKLTNIIIEDNQRDSVDSFITCAAIMEIRQEYFTTYVLNVNKSKELKSYLISQLLKKLADSS